MKKYDYDIVIIGFGKGGKTLAVECAGRGMRVALIERSPEMYGGTCINIGCIPTKSLIYSAHGKPAADDGHAAKNGRYIQALQRKDRVTGMLRERNLKNITQREGITLFTGEASFVSPHEVRILGQESPRTISGKNIVINTGSETAAPSVPGLESSSRVHTSTSILDLTPLPGHLIIAGGGYVGLEFATMFSGFGATVTILEAGPRMLPREDQDMAESICGVLTARGVRILTNARLLAGSETPQGLDISYTDASGATAALSGSALLLATGRKPAVTGLHLDAAGVALTQDGAIAVDDFLRTSQSHIWAIGDVKGGPQFTYISLDDYRIVRDGLSGSGKRSVKDRQHVAYTLFTDPPFARVGISEDQARAAGLDITVATLPASAVPCAHVLGQSEGLLKAVAAADSGKILGCALHCASAGEVVNTVAMAMREGRDHTFFRDMIFTHPSMSEALNDLFARIG